METGHDMSPHLKQIMGTFPYDTAAMLYMIYSDANCRKQKYNFACLKLYFTLINNNKNIHCNGEKKT